MTKGEEAIANQNSLIAEIVVNFLRKRIQVYQRLIPKYLKDVETYGEVKSSISFNDFMDKHKKLRNLINEVKSEEEKKTAAIELVNFEAAFSKYVELTNEEIEEILRLAKESITIHGLGDTPFTKNEASFITMLLERRGSLYNKSPKMSRLKNYLKYFKIMEENHAGFVDKISALFSWDSYYDFKITLKEETICFIDGFGVYPGQNKLADEDILVADDLKVAKFQTRDGQKSCLVVFLSTIIDGKTKIKQVYNNGYYDLGSSDLKEKVLNDPSTEWYSINDFLKIYGLGELIDHIYSFDDLFHIIHEFDMLQSFSEEQICGISIAVKTAAEFWANAYANNRITKIINVSAVKRFIHLLTKEIRVGLTRNPYYYLESRYSEGNTLYKIAKEAGLNLCFANENIVMSISHSEVTIGSDVKEEKTILYKFENNPNQGQGEGICPTLTPDK